MLGLCSTSSSSILPTICSGDVRGLTLPHWGHGPAPAHSKAIFDVGLKADGAPDPAAAQLARPGQAISTIRAIAVGVRVALQFAMDCRTVTAETAGNLRFRKSLFQHSHQATALRQPEVVILCSHSHPAHSRCRTWFEHLGISGKVEALRAIASGCFPMPCRCCAPERQSQFSAMFAIITVQEGFAEFEMAAKHTPVIG